jgi:hypothetical protein
MYIAYYIMRKDGDGDLCAVVENGESRSIEFSLILRIVIEQKLKEAGEDWFKVESPECDLPDVWDLTTNWDFPQI